MRIIEIPNQKEAILVLEKINYEVQGHQNILNFMIINNLTDSAQYKKCWNEYLALLKQYDIEKENFRKTYIVPEVGNNFNGTWEVNFITQEVSIHENISTTKI